MGGAGNVGCLASGGFNGGGDAGGCFGNPDYQEGAGGGASDIRIGGSSLANRVIVGGGGGGVGAYAGGGGGGAGGLTGLPGVTGQSGGGGGGTQAAGGAGGFGNGGPAGTSGSLGQGGIGGSHNIGGGGGGGGYYGGGGGGADADYCCADAGGGGGGSSYLGGVTSGTTMTGVNAGNGQIKITYTVAVCKTPVQVYHTDTTSSSAKVKWKAPSSNCTTGYELRIRRQLSPGVWAAWSSWTSPSGTLEHIFSSLLPGSFYNYQIHTNCGPGKTSPNVNDWFFTLGGGGFTNGGPISDLQDRNSNDGINSIQELPANLLMVPNPAKEFTTLLIEGFSNTEKTVTLFDLYGKLIFSVNAGVDDNLLELDLAKLNLHTGVYLIRVSDGKKQKTTQLMIER